MYLSKKLNIMEKMKIYTDELKLGNYITENNELIIVYDISNRINDVERINGKPTNNDLFKAILLTEEILYWFGFYKNVDRFYKGEMNLTLNGIIYWNENVICGKCIYLHHLQNIWFSLRMTNLILKK